MIELQKQHKQNVATTTKHNDEIEIVLKYKQFTLSINSLAIFNA